MATDPTADRRTHPSAPRVRRPGHRFDHRVGAPRGYLLGSVHVSHRQACGDALH